MKSTVCRVFVCSWLTCVLSAVCCAAAGADVPETSCDRFLLPPRQLDRATSDR